MASKKVKKLKVGEKPQGNWTATHGKVDVVVTEVKE